MLPKCFSGGFFLGFIDVTKEGTIKRSGAWEAVGAHQTCQQALLALLWSGCLLFLISCAAAAWRSEDVGKAGMGTECHYLW